MIFALRSKVLAVLILCFCINFTIAGRGPLHLHRRDGSTITDSSPMPSSRPTQSGGSKETDKGSESTTSKPVKASASVTSGSNSKSSSSSKSASPTFSISAVTSNINGAAPTSSYNNNSKFNSTLTPDQLPLTPEITPAFAVAGVILMISGVAYTLVGIRNQWLHISLSAAYLAGLSVTVLILYVMNPPVSNAIQGAYLVAISMTGLILGGAAIVFKEMTEGLGCLLGGFCFSMWLLVLKPGGLVTSTGGISGFIAAFSLAAFATSFSHVTRPYGLIGGISFAGATSIVLGIDCVSRAGLKEFWVYLWNLNDNLFPLGATTYPLTRGLRVEIAAIVVISLAGIVSQMKLWKIVKKRREQRSAERLQDERNIEQEEENVGRRIEQQNAQSRNQWETVYGDKDVNTSADYSNRDSGVGDMESKKGAMSTVTSLRRSAEEIEMADMSPRLTKGAGPVMTNMGQEGGPVTIRVARDVPVPQILDENGNPVEPTPNRLSHVSANSSTQQEPEENVWVMGADGEARMERRPSKSSLKRASGPNVVPLPFKVPEGDIEDDRSSVATFADDEQAGHKRLSHRLSTGSALFRKLSHRSQRKSQRISVGAGQSTEDLVIPHEVEDDRASSVAATMDGLSDDEDMRSVRSSMRNSRTFKEDQRASVAFDQLPRDSPPELGVNNEVEVSGSMSKRPISALTVATEILESAVGNEDKVVETHAQKSLTSSTDPKPKLETLDADYFQAGEAANAAPPAVSAVESNSASITKERLPAQLSKVVMSYRTNEWAKHLSGADVPDLEDLMLEEHPAEGESTSNEVAAPLHMEELQQTPESALRLPSRSMSWMSDRSAAPLTRSSSALSKLNPSSSRPDTSNSQPSLRPSLSHLNTRGLLARNSSTPNIPQPIVESSIEEGFSPSKSPNIPGLNAFSSPGIPFSSTSTLLGKRDSRLRQKSFVASPSALSSTPELTSSQFQNTNSSFVSEASTRNNAMDDDNISLSARRDLIRKSSLQTVSNAMSPLQQTPIPFDSHQPRRMSSAPHSQVREQQLASWRAGVQQGFQSTAQPATIERQRSALWQERQAEEQKKAIDARRRKERDSAFDQRMRRGDMLDAHREALRKMQASANRHA